MLCLLAVLQFLTELTRLFQKCRTSGSVVITLKKCKLWPRWWHVLPWASYLLVWAEGSAVPQGERGQILHLKWWRKDAIALLFINECTLEHRQSTCQHDFRWKKDWSEPWNHLENFTTVPLRHASYWRRFITNLGTAMQTATKLIIVFSTSNILIGILYNSWWIQAFGTLFIGCDVSFIFDAIWNALISLYCKTLILCRSQISVCFSDDGRTKPVPRKGHPETYEPSDTKCLIRASDGKKKISTVVSLTEV